MKKLLIICLCIIGIHFSELRAQNGSIGIVDAVGTSMGKTYTTMSRGVYALGINPANLAMSGGKHWEFAIPPNLSLRMGTDFLSIDEFNYFFGGVKDSVTGETHGKYLNSEDKDRLINLFKSGGEIMIDYSMLNFGFTWKPTETFGAIGFSVQDNFYARLKFPAGIIDLVMSGNPVGKEYSLDDLEFKTWYLRTYNFSYAHELNGLFPKLFDRLAIGFGVKYVSGFGYAALDKISTKVITNSDRTITEYGDLNFLVALSPDFNFKYDFDTLRSSEKFKFEFMPQAAGKGTGFDIGISGNITQKLGFGIAVTDIGKIKWDLNAAEYISSSSYTLKDMSDPNLRDSLKKAFTGKGHFIESFETELPTALRIGLCYVFKPDLYTLAADLNVGLNDAPRNFKGVRFSFGGEWNPLSWLPYLRGGLTFGGREFFSWNVGIGLNIGPMEFNAATPDFQYIFNPNSGKRVSFAANWRFRFN
jgi:hypothetical protein